MAYVHDIYPQANLKLIYTIFQNAQAETKYNFSHDGLVSCSIPVKFYNLWYNFA